MGKHTIILSQYTNQKNSRTFLDYETVTQAMDAICKMFEEKLKQLNPDKPQLVYGINEINSYIDGFGDLGCLVYDPKIQAYRPHNKEWIKARIYKHLQNQVKRT